MFSVCQSRQKFMPIKGNEKVEEYPEGKIREEG
jgi:hypothetical protein